VLVRPREVGVEYDLEHAPGLGPDGADGFLVVTNLGAPEFAVMWAPVDDPSAWTPFLPSDPAERVHGVDAFDRGFVLSLRRDGHAIVRFHPLGGEPFDVLPDDAGGMVRIGRTDDRDAAAVTVVVDSFIAPTRWIDVAWDGARSERHVRETVGVDASAYVTERRLAPSPDGTLVPVILVRHKDTPLDGTAPCLLYGYGSYESVDDPWFDPTLLPVLDRGVVFAKAHIRGGGEISRRQWIDGHLLAKRNTFTDFIAAADHLADGVVDGSRIVGRGGSAGGLLQGAVYFMAPQRWAGILAEVPFVDVVNSMLDTEIPLTITEWEEWGNPGIPEQRAYMESYAPYLNLPDVDLRPPLLVTGAVHDPRVLVHEPAKWVAALRHSDPECGHRAATSDRGSVVFRVELGEGSHGGQAARYAALAEESEILHRLGEAVGDRRGAPGNDGIGEGMELQDEGLLGAVVERDDLAALSGVLDIDPPQGRGGIQQVWRGEHHLVHPARGVDDEALLIVGDGRILRVGHPDQAATRGAQMHTDLQAAHCRESRFYVHGLGHQHAHQVEVVHQGTDVGRVRGGIGRLREPAEHLGNGRGEST